MSYFDPNALKASPARAVEDFAKNDAAPAALIEVARGGVSVRSASGTVTLGGDTAATTDSRFEIGSQTKMMTAVVVQQLVAEGAIDLDAPLADQMDLTGLEGIANIQDVTVRQLLANRSGIPDFDTVPGQNGQTAIIERLLSNPTKVLGPDEQLAIASGQPASFAAGTAYEYSNTNYTLLQKLTEQVTGQSFGKLLSERIFEPCGMKDSALKVEGGLDGVLNSYAELVPGQPIDVTQVPLDLGAAGGVVSTTSDMVRFFDALLISRTLLAPKQMSEMLDFRGPDGSPSPGGESFGLSTGMLFGQHFIGFQGQTLGTSTGTFLHVESGTIISVAGTHSSSEITNLFQEAFASVFNDDSWASFDPSDDSFTINGAAADITLTEDADVSGNPQTVLELNDASLRFEGRISDLDTGRLNFKDGSTLWIADQDGDNFDILQDATKAFDKNNQLIGLDGDDDLSGGHGDDRIIGGSGDDFLSGRKGNDKLDGGAGSDYLDGGRGDDLLKGGSGEDVLIGGAGDDRLEGGAGDDIMVGGSGADVFVFNTNAGSDQIYGFEVQQDKLDLSQTGLSFEDLKITNFGFFSQVSYGDSDICIISDSCTPLTEDSFIF